ncbi:10377_t:CDS:2 [Acaulospora colombiana]|uniref:10377_t:CDS:1 n=1 Tax=Acaulospora colombiana TaxID=27376 RepID=A0ACA9KWE8_9GLOM|nr:10377_t:CDS:2 [Acaulospora colombiana]
MTPYENSLDNLSSNSSEYLPFNNNDNTHSDPSTSNNGKKRSQVWNYFTKPSSSTDIKTHKVKCPFSECGKELTYSSATSSLRYHLTIHNINVNANKQSKGLIKNRRKKNLKKQKEPSLLHIKTYQPPKLTNSQMVNSYNLLLPKLRNMLQQVESVSLAIVTWKLENYGSYTEITCHWISDDFQLREVLLDIVRAEEVNGSWMKSIELVQ